jgi:hypothetical protein
MGTTPPTTANLPLPFSSPIIFTILIKFTCFVNHEIQTRNHYTTTSIVSILRFHSSCIITNQE